MRSKAYRGIDVNRVDLARLLLGRVGQAVHVGLDVGKDKIWVMLRWNKDEFDRPWIVRNPDQLGLLVHLLQQLAGGRDMSVAMEPTGTYGDCLRQAFAHANIPLRRVSPKMAHDHAESFDGVPSQHDAKDAAVVAELAGQGRSWLWPWPARSEADQEREFWVDHLDAQRRQVQMWYGRLEASMSRHWPEATRLLKLSSSTLLRILAHYGGPRGLSADPDALAKVSRWGRRLLSPAKAEALRASARTTAGVAMGRWDEERMRRWVAEIQRCRQEMKHCRQRIAELAKGHAMLEAQAEVVGTATASVLLVHLREPSQYHSSSAYVKAMGLNLAERSSGRYKGQLKISKRGPAAVRRWLYLAALRWVRCEPVKSWYAKQKASRRGKGKPALVGVMRKLARALWSVGARGEAFESARLFEGKKGSRPELDELAWDAVLGAGEP